MNVSAWWRTHPWFAASDQHDSSGGKMRIRRKEEEKKHQAHQVNRPTCLTQPKQRKRVKNEEKGNEK